MVFAFLYMKRKVSLQSTSTKLNISSNLACAAESKQTATCPHNSERAVPNVEVNISLLGARSRSNCKFSHSSFRDLKKVR